MKKSTRTLPWLISLFSVFCGYAQNAPTSALDSLAGNFIKYLRKSPGEKVLLNTDKWFYLSGETIWFKAYTLNALSNKISVQSKILFVDLVDERDHAIHQVMLNIPQSRLEGNINIPVSTPEGYYWLRAYTRKMLDEDSSKIFVQPVYVLNPRKPDSSIALQINQTSRRGADKEGEPIVSFYPEGGSMISGTTTVIAFRSMDKAGKPADVTGYVTEGKDTVVKDFKTSLPGIGKLNLDIWKSRKYVAHVKWKDKQFEYPLPLINQYASQLSVIAQNENTFQVRVSLGDSLYHKNKVHSLIGISRDSLCFAATGTDMYEIYVPKSSFPKGLATLLLFNDQNKVVSERDVYINKDNHIVSISTDKNLYGGREKARFELTVTDSLFKPVRTLCSVAITDDNMDKQSGLESPASNYIFASLDLPQPASSYSVEELDLIMLTQKPKFSDWTYVRDPLLVPTKSYLEDSSIEFIRGSILNNKDEPVSDQVVTLFSTQKNIIFLSETTDQHGRFRFRLPSGIADSSVMTLQVANQKGTKVDKKIVLDPPSIPHPKTPKLLRKRFDASRQIFLRDFKATQMDTTKFGKGKEWLKEVTVIAAKKKQLNYDERKRLSLFSSIITSDKFDRGGVNSLGMAVLMAPGIHLKQGYVAIKGGFGFG
ncbi:MAG TPA: hypothetical protein VK543_14650, partial [Puia sp.]|nr:hypothetical protein [Puia sp.]